jgi:hypothetical protein
MPGVRVRVRVSRVYWKPPAMSSGVSSPPLAETLEMYVFSFSGFSVHSWI